MPRPHRPVRSRCLLLAPLLLALPALACSTPRGPRADEIPVRVRGVAVDPRTQTPVVVLEEEDGERSLPIWIGFAEARSIADGIEGTPPPRPNTHDLAKRLIRGLDARLERVVVTELRDDTYYALLVLRVGRSVVEIDSRPSDAIAIALRFEAPVFVREDLFGSAQDAPPPEGGEETQAPGERI
jgi:uncharacterized protein